MVPPVIIIIQYFFFVLVKQSDPVQGLVDYLQSHGHKDKRLKKVRKTMVRQDFSLVTRNEHSTDEGHRPETVYSTNFQFKASIESWQATCTY